MATGGASPAAGSWMSQKPSPPMAFMCGYTTAMAAAAATMASTAVPPSRSTSRPACAARWWGATIMPP